MLSAIVRISSAASSQESEVEAAISAVGERTTRSPVAKHWSVWMQVIVECLSVRVKLSAVQGISAAIDSGAFVSDVRVWVRALRLGTLGWITGSKRGIQPIFPVDNKKCGESKAMALTKTNLLLIPFYPTKSVITSTTRKAITPYSVTRALSPPTSLTSLNSWYSGTGCAARLSARARPFLSAWHRWYRTLTVRVARVPLLRLRLPSQIKGRLSRVHASKKQSWVGLIFFLRPRGPDYSPRAKDLFSMGGWKKLWGSLFSFSSSRGRAFH